MPSKIVSNILWTLWPNFCNPIHWKWNTFLFEKEIIENKSCCEHKPKTLFRSFSLWCLFRFALITFLQKFFFPMPERQAPGNQAELQQRKIVHRIKWHNGREDFIVGNRRKESERLKGEKKSAEYGRDVDFVGKKEKFLLWNLNSIFVKIFLQKSKEHTVSQRLHESIDSLLSVFWYKQHVQNRGTDFFYDLSSFLATIPES